MPNKIKYGIKNCYYAKATIAADGSATYDTPVALPGAVSLTLDASGDINKFYADNIVYWQGLANNGYTGSIELALVPDSFKKDILGQVEQATDKTLYETMQSTGSPFALMFQFEGDVKATRHVLYNCVANRPSQNGTTKNESIEPQTETINIEAASIYVSALDADLVKCSTTDTTTTSVYNAWTTSVYVPGV
jgi:phi13 family phage major tail protein